MKQNNFEKIVHTKICKIKFSSLGLENFKYKILGVQNGSKSKN